MTLPKGALHFSCPFWVFGLLLWSTEILAISVIADVVDICNIYDDGLPSVRSAWTHFAAKFEYVSHSIYYVNHNVAEEDPYDKGVV